MSTPNFIPRRKLLSEVMTHYEDAEFAREYPAIYQLLCHAKVDGQYRAGARLSIFADDDKLKASIWDPASGQVWFCTLEAFKGALEAVEKLLEANRGEWRVRKENGRR
jgi:hypothetical protein